MGVHPTIKNKDKHLIKKGWGLMLTNDMYKEVNIFMKYCINKYKKQINSML